MSALEEAVRAEVTLAYGRACRSAEPSKKGVMKGVMAGFSRTVRTFTLNSAALRLAASGCDCRTVRVFQQKFTLGIPLSFTSLPPLVACCVAMRVTNGIPRGCPLLTD